MKIVIYHSGYGCGTGCCGHRIEVENAGPEDLAEDFTFDHPHKEKDYREWAEDLICALFGKEHITDLDWDNCIVIND